MFQGIKDFEPSWPRQEHLLTEAELMSLNLFDRPLWIAPILGDKTKYNFWEAEDGGTESGTPVQLWERTQINRRNLDWKIQSAEPGDSTNDQFIICYHPISDSETGDIWLSINSDNKAVLTTKKAYAQKFYIRRLEGGDLGAEINLSMGQFLFYPVNKQGNASVLRPLGREDDNWGNSTKIMTVGIDVKAQGWLYAQPRWRLMKVQEIGEDLQFITHDNMAVRFFDGKYSEYDYDLSKTGVVIMLKASENVGRLWWQVFDRSEGSDCSINLCSEGTTEIRELSRLLWRIEPSSRGPEAFHISTTLNGKKKYVFYKDGNLYLGKVPSRFKIRIAGYDTSSIPYDIKLFLYDKDGEQVVQGRLEHQSHVILDSVGKIMDPFERELCMWGVHKPSS